jgi:SAM-dependent methyltransferase
MSASPNPRLSERSRTERQMLDKNRSYYDPLWRDAALVEPQRFNTWPLVQSLAATSPRRLEVAPGLRPRLPLAGTQFVDISQTALRKLHDRGAQVIQSVVTALPFADASFDLVCAFDIIEHVEDDNAALAELARVARLGGTVMLSTPLYAAYWTPFDELVGHKRRYEPPQLLEQLAHHGFEVERSAVFGMKPRSSRLVDLGMWWLTHHRERAMWWYNRVFMKLGLFFQKELQFSAGMIATEGVDEVLLVCRRVDSASRH